MDDSFGADGNYSGIVVTDYTFPNRVLHCDIDFTLDGNILLYANYDNVDEKKLEKRVFKFDEDGNTIDDFGTLPNIIIDDMNDITLQVDNFNFNDFDGNQFKAVIIDSLPESGHLLLDGDLVKAGQIIDVSLIETGKLTYQSELNIFENHRVNIIYRVQDNGGTENGGVDTSSQGSLIIEITPDNGHSVNLQTASYSDTVQIDSYDSIYIPENINIEIGDNYNLLKETKHDIEDVNPIEIADVLDSQQELVVGKIFDNSGLQVENPLIDSNNTKTFDIYHIESKLGDMLLTSSDFNII